MGGSGAILRSCRTITLLLAILCGAIFLATSSWAPEGPLVSLALVAVAILPATYMVFRLGVHEIASPFAGRRQRGGSRILLMAYVYTERLAGVLLTVGLALFSLYCDFFQVSEESLRSFGWLLPFGIMGLILAQLMRQALNVICWVRGEKSGI